MICPAFVPVLPASWALLGPKCVSDLSLVILSVDSRNREGAMALRALQPKEGYVGQLNERPGSDRRSL